MILIYSKTSIKKTDTKLNQTLGVIKSILLWVGGLLLWFLYCFYTLDRSQAAYEATGGNGPMVSGYSIVILGVLLAILMSKQVFNRRKNWKSIVSKTFVGVIILIGLFNQLSYDPLLSNLKNSQTSKKDFTGMDLYDAVNEHRESIGVQKIELEEAFCGNLVERWMAVKNPKNGHHGFNEWWSDKNLVEDPYGQINELYASAHSAERVIEIWTQSPGHKIPLEDPKYNVGCTYAADGWGVLIIGEKPSL